MARHTRPCALSLTWLCLVTLCSVFTLPQDSTGALLVDQRGFKAECRPTYVIPSASHDRLSGATTVSFSPDSRSLIVHTHPLAVNVWEALGPFWRASLDVACKALDLGGLFGNAGMGTHHDWWWTRLLRWAKQEGHTIISQRARPISRFVELELATGRVGPAVFTWPNGHWYRLTPLSGDRWLASASFPRKEAQLLLFDARLARVVRTYSYAGDNAARWAAPYEGPFVAGCSADRVWVYSVWVDGDAQKARCVAWNTMTGEDRLVFETDTGEDLQHHGPHSLIYVIPGGNELALELPLRPPSGGPQRGASMLIRDLAQGGRIIRTIPVECTPRGPIFSPDGNKIFAYEDKLDDLREYWNRPNDIPANLLEPVIRGWDVRTGDELPMFSGFPDGYSAIGQLVCGENTEHVFVTVRDVACPTSEWMILVGDMEEYAWVDRLYYSECAEPCQLHTLRVSPDGRWLATVCYRKPRERPTRVILVWDLTGVTGARR